MIEFLAEVITYVQLGERETLLRELHPRLQPHFPTVADRFYKSVFENAGSAAVISGPEQVERLRHSLIDWMSSGLLGPYDDKFYEALADRPASRPDRSRAAVHVHGDERRAHHVHRADHTDVSARRCVRRGARGQQAARYRARGDAAPLPARLRREAVPARAPHSVRSPHRDADAVRQSRAQVRNPLNAAPPARAARASHSPVSSTTPSSPSRPRSQTTSSRGSRISSTTSCRSRARPSSTSTSRT